MSKGHKRSLTSVYDLLATHGIDVVSLNNKIKDCIVKTMISGLPHLSNTYRSCQPENYAANMCFELLGFDVMLNDKAEPIII
jgi:tubulin polyglutamylase TTLL6/13